MIHLSVNGAHLAPFERFANCGHGVVPDAPERTMALIRDFIQRC
jgi:proline iminopeptidase